MSQKLNTLFRFAFPKVCKVTKNKLGAQIDAKEGYIKKTLPLLVCMTGCIYLQNRYRNSFSDHEGGDHE